MRSPTLWLLYRSVILTFAVALYLLQASPVLAQAAAGHDTRRQPYKIKLVGIVNSPQPDEQSLGVVTLGFSIYRQTLSFEVTALEAPNYPHLSTKTILRQAKGRSVNFHLLGPRELLSKIAQSQPGTPLRMVGMFTPRTQDLQLMSVDEIGFTGKY